MARCKNSSDGSIAEAIAGLVANQAAFAAQAGATDRRLNEMERINTERFARIEAILLEHSRILADHTRILQDLRDAVRERIGFKST